MLKRMFDNIEFFRKSYVYNYSQKEISGKVCRTVASRETLQVSGEANKAQIGGEVS